MDDRRKQILAALAQMDKQFGKGSVLMLGSRAALPVEVIPTGSIAIDNALGVGGFPRGRVVEIFGPESSGKTTLALHVIAEAQRTGGAAAFIDAEHALDPTYATRLGVDTENLIVSQPDYGEQALEIAQALVMSQAIDVIVIDSVAALTPKAEIEGEMGDSHMGLQARMMSQALRKLTACVSRESDVLDLGVQQALLEKSGSWYSYKGERIGQGRDTARQTLIDRPELCRGIEAELRKTLGLNGSPGRQNTNADFELTNEKDA